MKILQSKLFDLNVEFANEFDQWFSFISVLNDFILIISKPCEPSRLNGARNGRLAWITNGSRQCAWKRIETEK